MKGVLENEEIATNNAIFVLELLGVKLWVNWFINIARTISLLTLFSMSYTIKVI